MEVAIAKARGAGIGACAPFPAQPLRRRAAYALRAAREGLIGLATTNSVAVAPPGGGGPGEQRCSVRHPGRGPPLCWTSP